MLAALTLAVVAVVLRIDVVQVHQAHTRNDQSSMTCETLCGYQHSGLQSQLVQIQRRLEEQQNEIDELKGLEHESVRYSSCKEIADNDRTSRSGEYSIVTATGRILTKVYCEMRLHGGGYTFIKPEDLSSLTNNEVQAMFTDRSNFLIRVRDGSGIQRYGVLEQMPRYRYIALKLGLNEHRNYTSPKNHRFLRHPYLYFGFVNRLVARENLVNGLQVNNRTVSYSRCLDIFSSHIALFPNFDERVPTRYDFNNLYPVCRLLFSTLRANPSHRIMPIDYFMFAEIHFGGCGCYTQPDGRRSIEDVVSAAIGFR